MEGAQLRHYPRYYHPQFIPICQVHREVMDEYSRRGITAYYRCPHPDCKERGKSYMVEYESVRRSVSSSIPMPG